MWTVVSGLIPRSWTSMTSESRAQPKVVQRRGGHALRISPERTASSTCSMVRSQVGHEVQVGSTEMRMHRLEFGFGFLSTEVDDVRS